MQSLTSALSSSLFSPANPSNRPTSPNAQPVDGAEEIPSSDDPTLVNFSSEHLVIGAGVAIFHVASARVVLCWHPRDEYWFLPKGRRNADEESGEAGEREGWEEVSFNFLLNSFYPSYSRVCLYSIIEAHC